MGEIDSSTRIVRDFNITLLIIDRGLEQHKKPTSSNYKAFYPTTEYTLFSSEHGTSFSSLDHILGHKSILNRLKKKIYAK